MSKKLKEQNETITFRLPKDVKEKMTTLIIRKTCTTNSLYGVSKYLRELIEKEFKNENNGK